MEHYHDYQIVLIGPEEPTKSKNPNAKGTTKREIWFKNLTTNKNIKTFIVKGFANYDNWKPIIDYQDAAKDLVWNFESTMKQWIPSKQIYIRPKFALNLKGHIDADAVPTTKGKDLSEYLLENEKHTIIQEQLDSTFGMLFDANDIVKLDSGGYAIERVIK